MQYNLIFSSYQANAFVACRKLTEPLGKGNVFAKEHQLMKNLFERSGSEYPGAKDPFWSTVGESVYAMHMSEAFPLDQGCDPNDDIAQSAAAGRTLVNMCNAYRDRWRYNLCSPNGMTATAGMVLIPKFSPIILVSCIWPEWHTLSFERGTRLRIACVIRILYRNRWNGQYFAKITGHETIAGVPIDWGAFTLETS